jgi:hypothetical protein
MRDLDVPEADAAGCLCRRMPWRYRGWLRVQLFRGWFAIAQL